MPIILITLLVTIMWAGYLTVRHDGWWPAWLAGVFVIMASSALGFAGGAALGRRAPAPPKRPPPGEWKPVPLPDGEIADHFVVRPGLPNAHVVTRSYQLFNHPCYKEDAAWVPDRAVTARQGSCMPADSKWSGWQALADVPDPPGTPVVERLVCNHLGIEGWWLVDTCLYVILENGETWRWRSGSIQQDYPDYGRMFVIMSYSLLGALAGWLAGSGLFALLLRAQRRRRTNRPL